jgi:ATP-dependent DNA helicase RecQ
MNQAFIHPLNRRVPVCAGYFDADMLFDVGGLVDEPGPVPSFVASTFSILTRGAPTQPSPMLQELLGFRWAELSQEPLVLMARPEPDWADTIRGNDEGYNPALEFFTQILPNNLGPWSFIQKLMVPEYPLFRELGAPASLRYGPNAERVDFYLPHADLVIEIDGEQHLHQGGKDQARDRFLEKFGILVLRLKTSDLRARSTAFADFMVRLRRRCEDSPRLQSYRVLDVSPTEASPSPRYDLTAAIRLQMAMMLAISHRQLEPGADEWRLNVSHDLPTRKGVSWVEAAVVELFDWFSLFARLKHVEFKPPKLVIDRDGLMFDVQLFGRADDLTELATGITVRTCSVQDRPFIEDPAARGIKRLRYYGVSYLAVEKPATGPGRPPAITDLTELCRRIFGHESFRPGQDTLILNALDGQRSLGLMPTGGGKSLCFQVPALLQMGTTITVVPIKALGRDHCAELEGAGFTGRVVNIDSDMPAALREIYAQRILRGEMRFVFVSPERFQTENFRDTVRLLREENLLRMFVIDEVHCMSEWGHDFRPSYLTLPGCLRDLALEVPVMGLTATASVNVLRDIQSEFEIPEEFIAYEMHRSRTELNFSIRTERGGPAAVTHAIEKIVAESQKNEPPPVHVFSRYVNGDDGVDAIALNLSAKNPGLRVGVFSGKEPKKFNPGAAVTWMRDEAVSRPRSFDEYKQTVQSLWKQGRLDVVVTTKAFGMGVNKPDVRHTIHAGMPSSMEAFYQEAGRAGRDREPAHCHMLFQPENDDAEKIWLKLEKDLSPRTLKEVLGHGGRGDFRAQLWFLEQGLISLEDEHRLVARLHSIIRSSRQDCMEIRVGQMGDMRLQGQRFQLSLFRLYQMGLIKPWAVVDWGRRDGDGQSVQAVEVERTNTGFQEACASLLRRMKAVDGEGTETEAMRHVESLKHGQELWPELYTELLKWVQRTQRLSRLQSTWNLYRACISFRPEGAEAFRNELEAFFKVDSTAFQLAALRDMNLAEAAETLHGLISRPDSSQLKERSALALLLAQLSRLLEGTSNSRGLNLAAACLQLLTEDRPGLEAMQRLRTAVPEGGFAFWKGAGKNLLPRVAATSLAAQDMVAEWILADRPSRQQILELYDELAAKPVEDALLACFSTELADAL